MIFRKLILGALVLPLHAFLQAHDSAKFLQPVQCNCMMYQPMYPPVYQPMYQPVMYQPIPPQMYQPALPGRPVQFQPALPGQTVQAAAYQPVYQLRASSLIAAQQAPVQPGPAPAPAMAPAPLTPPVMAPAPVAPPSAVAPPSPGGPPPGPNPNCPCLTTPAPTEEPGSPDASEAEVAQAAEEAAKDGKQEILEAGQKETADQKKKVQKAGEEGSKELATKELAKVKEENLGPHVKKLETEKENADEIEKDMKNKARDAALKHTDKITEAAAELSTIKAKNVINKVLEGSAEVAKASEERAIELAKEAEETNAVALAISNKALQSAHDAQFAALKYPHDTAKQATNTAEEAEKKALYTWDQQAAAQKMAESAAAAAEHAKQVAAEAFVTATTAKSTAEKALKTATENGIKLVKLKERAEKAMNAADGAARATKMAEATVAEARAAREAALAVTTPPPGEF